MTVQIDSSIEDLIERLVASGRYANATDVIEQAVALLRQRDQNEELIRSVRESRAAARRGERFPLTDELMDEIRRNAEEAERLGRPIDPFNSLPNGGTR